MADNLAEIRKIFADKSVPLGQNDVWAVQGVPVVKHKALERLATAIKIKWHEPKILRAEKDEAVILVAGSIGDHMEWSIGEAMIVPAAGVGGNYKVSGKQASYVWAMAEKRGKDRVIIKLAGIDAYSEEESDDFTRSNGREPERDAADIHAPTSDEIYVKHALAKIEAFDSEAALNEWYKTETEARQRLLDSDQIALLFGKARDKRKALRPAAPASEAA